MNRRYSRRKYARASSGQSIVEFAVAVGVLTLLLVVVADFARVFYESVGLQNAARAGAQYGSQSVITAADVNGMEAAATLDGSQRCQPDSDRIAMHLPVGIVGSQLSVQPIAAPIRPQLSSRSIPLRRSRPS